MNYEMSEHDSDWHGPMSDPNTGGNWREEFRRGLIEIGFGALGTAELERIERLIEKTRRDAYRAGLERAKALVPEELGPILCGKCNLNGPLCEGCYANRQVNKVLDDMLSALDAEIKKDTTSQLSERDTDWCGLPDENARATSDL